MTTLHCYWQLISKAWETKKYADLKLVPLAHCCLVVPQAVDRRVPLAHCRLWSAFTFGDLLDSTIDLQSLAIISLALLVYTW